MGKTDLLGQLSIQNLIGRAIKPLPCRRLSDEEDVGHLALQKKTSHKQRPSTPTLNSLLYSLLNLQLTNRGKLNYTPEVLVNQGEFPPTEVTMLGIFICSHIYSLLL